MRTLVLNAGYEPLAIVSFKRALVLVMNDKATIVERMEEDPVWSTERDGAHSGCAVKEWHTCVPRWAMRSKFGVRSNGFP